MSVYKSKDNQIIYTSDFQVLFFVFIIKKIYPKKKTLTIYHQFELIEQNKLTKLNKFFYSYALRNINKLDLAIFPEINRLNYFIEESGLEKHKSFILPNTCELSSINTNPTKHNVLEQFSEENFIVAHLGNVGGDQHYFKNFINATQKLITKKGIVFLFLGRKNKKIDDIINQQQLTNVHFIDAVPHNELSQVYPFIDLGVILYKGTGYNYEFCAPNKLYEFWSYGIPVIGHSLKGLNPLFDKPEKGLLTCFDNEADIANTIIEIKNRVNNKEELKKIFETELSISSYLVSLKKKLEELN